MRNVIVGLAALPAIGAATVAAQGRPLDQRSSHPGRPASLSVKDAIGQQFGAAVDSLDGAIRACPDGVWITGERWHQPWYLAFHTLFWLDLYLSESALDYVPPPPFTRGELEEGVYPERPYLKQELLDWLQECRKALAARLSTISTDEGIRRRCHLPWFEMEAGELLLYVDYGTTLRYVNPESIEVHGHLRRCRLPPMRRSTTVASRRAQP